jgi:serine phosphatase RsbU (regulator of sigma subunit)
MNAPNEDDLEAARQIRMGLLPPSPLRLDSWEVAGRLVMMGEYSDSFDYYPLGDGRCALSITRISGDGMAAARLMSDLHALQRIHCNGSSTTSEAMKRLNKHVFQELGHQDIRMLYAEFDPKRGVLFYSNAGYYWFPLLRRRDGSPAGFRGQLDRMLGVAEDVDFTEVQFSIESGGSLLLYNEGIVRAVDPLLMGFEGARLLAFWERGIGASQAEAIETILVGIQAFWDRGLLVSAETLPAISDIVRDHRPLENVGPSRMEAEWLRRSVRRQDMALVVLGRRSV